jgi:NAD(P)H-hydrate epimerase
MKAISVAQARALDRDAVERLGMPSILLMENAARGVAAAAQAMGERFVVLCGPGNNGGDGLAAARHLGAGARVFLLAEPDAQRAPDAALQLRILRNAGFAVEVGRLPEPDAERSVWIDALFGTGLTRPLGGAAARWVEFFNAAAGPKLCVDIPSGLHGDRGDVLGVACRADVTVTFEAPKHGLLVPAARALVGRLVVVPLGLPPGCGGPGPSL